jgi:hypothetical protein
MGVAERKMTYHQKLWNIHEKKGRGRSEFGTLIIFSGTHGKINLSVPKKKESDSSKKEHCMIIMANTC